MTRLALVSLLWGHNNNLLRIYLAGRSRVVLAPASNCTEQLRTIVEESGGQLVSLESLINDDATPVLHARADEMVAQLRASQGAAEWRDFATARGLAGSRFDEVVLEHARAHLYDILFVIEALDSAARRYDIELVLTNEDLMQTGRTLVEWAHARGIPSLHLAHGIALATPFTVHAGLNAEHMAVFGERGGEGYRDVGVAPERMSITGNPAWDVYAGLGKQKQRVRDIMYRKYRLDGTAPLLVFGTTWAADMNSGSYTGIYEETLGDFLAACRRMLDQGRSLNIVIKDRVSNAASGKSRCLAVASRFGFSEADFVYTFDDVRMLVTAADILVSLDSNLSVEAMHVGTPAVNLMNELGLRMGPSFDAESGILEAAPEELPAVLDMLLNDQELRAGVIELASLKLGHYNIGGDGSASERVANLMARMARRYEQAARVERPASGYVWERLSKIEDASLLGLYHDRARIDLLALVDHIPRRVLDIGCAAGATGEYLKKTYPDCWVAGIELSSLAAEKARERIDLVLRQKIEEVDFDKHGITPGSIDTVIVADVLEHVYDPWGALLRLRPLLSDDAQILASIPNARNLWLMHHLASGNFSYTTEGLLDITHIRWFTRAEIERMFRETGYRVMRTERTYSGGMENLTRPVGSTMVETEKLILKDIGDEEFEDLKTLQFLMLVRPVSEEHAGTQDEDFYRLWQLGHSYLKRDAMWIAERMETWSRQPLLHLVVILQEAGKPRLANNVRALGHQFYQNWRLTIVADHPADEAIGDNPRIAWVSAPADDLVETANTVLMETPADWVAMFEAGDKLAPHALYAFVDLAVRQPGLRLMYSDEDSVDALNEHLSPFFKTDFNLEMLRAAPYTVGGLLVVEHELFHELGGFDATAEGVESMDLVLRAWERVGVAGIGHIPDVLYHRSLDGGHCRGDAAAVAVAHRRAVMAHFERIGVAAEIDDGLLPGTLHVRYPIVGNPLVSILVPTRNQVDFLKRCLTSVIEGTGYGNCEILVLDNGSDAADAVEYLDQLRALGSASLRVLDCPGPFNFSAMNNRGAREAHGEYLLLLNNDTGVLHPEWLQEMLGLAQQADVGVVGAKLFFPDGKVQHAGVIMGINDAPADHPFLGKAADATGYFGRALLPQDLTAVTAACMLVRKSVYDEVGGLDEEKFRVSYNDVDFCLRVRQHGYRVVFTPHARLLHEGSASQTGKVEAQPDQAKQARFQAEQDRFYDTWRREVAFDPYYNRNLSTHGRDFLVEIAPALAWDPGWRPGPRVLAHPADRFGCGEYRIIAPQRALNDAGRIMGWETGNYLTPPELFRMEPDSIVLQRQVDPHQLDFMERYIRHSKAFRVYEIDDLITNIPIKSIRKKHFVEQKDLHKRFRKGVSMCDRFVVSTEYLAEQYKGYNSDIVVVPNYLERARWGDLSPQRRGGAKARVGWAGSVTHDGDLAIISDVVKATAKEVDWVFLGMCPDSIRPYVAEYHTGVKLDDYPAKLASLDLDLAVAPLEEVPFNHGKSHLRLLEYGILGFPVICTDITPYRGDYPVTRVANRFKDWVEAIREHVADRDALANLGDELRDYMRARWMLEDHLDAWQSAWLP